VSQVDYQTYSQENCHNSGHTQSKEDSKRLNKQKKYCQRNKDEKAFKTLLKTLFKTSQRAEGKIAPIKCDWIFDSHPHRSKLLATNIEKISKIIIFQSFE
jgi:hypothetical protein